jgi:pimeloyl-ACP methyl ester carboxylesterase
MRIVLSLVIAAALGAPALVVAQDQFFESNGVRIHYREAGAGEPVVLIHGLGNSLESAWIATGVISALARDHRVIAFDSRGHGKSGPARPSISRRIPTASTPGGKRTPRRSGARRTSPTTRRRSPSRRSLRRS